MDAGPWKGVAARCGKGCYGDVVPVGQELNQCIEFFKKQKGESNEMDNGVPKTLTSNEKLPFRRSLFWDAPLRMISMSDQTRIPKSFATYYLPKWALSSTTAISS